MTESGAQSLSEKDAVDTTKVRMGPGWMKDIHGREQLQQKGGTGNKIDSFERLLHYVNEEARTPNHPVLFLAEVWC